MLVSLGKKSIAVQKIGFQIQKIEAIVEKADPATVTENFDSAQCPTAKHFQGNLVFALTPAFWHHSCIKNKENNKMKKVNSKEVMSESSDLRRAWRRFDRKKKGGMNQ